MRVKQTLGDLVIWLWLFFVVVVVVVVVVFQSKSSLYWPSNSSDQHFTSKLGVSPG